MHNIEPYLEHKKDREGKVFGYLIILVAIPLIIAIGVSLFNDRKYNLISILIAFLSCIPFFLSFEKRNPKPTEMILIAVMTAISVVGRFIFAPIPGFKPVTAITVITAIYFGPQAGFLTGSLSAVVSNILFGQGPWTPFQMFVWGFLGFIAGLLAKNGWLEKKWQLAIYGIIAGVAFSLMMDIWTVLSMDGNFNLLRYQAAVLSSLPFMAVYAVSNVIFLLVLTKPIGKKLERVKKKYGLN
ncbi:ECF transporter S component [Anaerovorax sp. IOR16]|uniref:ECF transporter S component n=1 Tax=Anaerovorax sp. IOR16 TaxID=2773458 RepID=UPI002ED01AA7